MASHGNLYQLLFLSIFKGGLSYEAIFKLQDNFAFDDCTTVALHRVETKIHIFF